MTDLLQYLDIIKQKDAHASTLQPRFEVVKAYLVDVQNLGIPFVSSRPGFVWVREYGANGGVFQAFLSPKVQARVDLPVLVMHSPVKPFLRQVVDVDWSEMINYAGFDDQPLLGLHAPDHEWPDFTPGADPVNVYLRALVPLKTFPSTGLTVNISPFVYEVDNEIREYFGEIGFDLSEFQPASGEAVRVLVYFDVESNSAQAIAGDPVADVPTITPPTPVVPENAYQSALIRLDGDQTTFAELDIKDVRSLFEISKTSSIRGATLKDLAVAVGDVEYLLADHIVNHPGGGGTPGGSNTQLQYNADGDFAGTSGLTWNSTTNTLTHAKSTSTTLEAFLILDQNGSGGAYMYMYAGSTYGRVGMTSSYFDISSPEDIVITGDNVVLTSANDTIIDAGGYLATVFQGGGSDPAAIFNNPNWGNYHFQIKTENNDFMVWVDSGIDAFQIGTDVAGTIADFRSTAIVFNDAEADVNIRWAGDGVTDAYFYDAGLNRHGFGTSTPGSVVYIDNTETSGIPETGLTVDNTYAPGSDPGSVFPTSLSLFADYDSSVTPSGGFTLAQFLRVRNVANGVMSARCLDIQFQNLGTGTTGFYTGVNVRTPTNSGGGVITTAYGLKIENQNLAAVNYAIYTDAGTVRIGDRMTVAGFLNVGTTSDPPAGSNIIHVSGAAPGFWFTDTSAADNNLFLVFDATLMQFQNRTDAGVVSSTPFIVDLASATNTFRINSGRVGIGADPSNVSAKLEISSTTGALLLPRMTTTQQNALTAVNGMIIYNSSTNKVRGYAGGAWVDLH